MRLQPTVLVFVVALLFLSALAAAQNVDVTKIEACVLPPLERAGNAVMVNIPQRTLDVTPDGTPVNVFEQDVQNEVCVADPAQFTIPPHAIEVQQDVFNLGTAVVDGKNVEGYVFVHHREFAKPPGAGNNKQSETCFVFLAKGAKWKTVEPWLGNPANTEGLNGAFVTDNLATDIQKWENHANVDILGAGTSTAAMLIADTAAPDGLNEVYFSDISDPGAIAVTIVWGVFSGPPAQRELVEWDMVYDQIDFDWSGNGEAGTMDFENIATHEIGHAAGMSHPPDTCTEETMYRFADFGETKKRDLNAGDITGIQQLYA